MDLGSHPSASGVDPLELIGGMKHRSKRHHCGEHNQAVAHSAAILHKTTNPATDVSELQSTYAPSPGHPAAVRLRPPYGHAFIRSHSKSGQRVARLLPAQWSTPLLYADRAGTGTLTRDKSQRTARDLPGLPGSRNLDSPQRYSLVDGGSSHRESSFRFHA